MNRLQYYTFLLDETYIQHNTAKLKVGTCARYNGFVFVLTLLYVMKMMFEFRLLRTYGENNYVEIV